MLAFSYPSHNRLQSAFSLIIVALAIYELLTPTPQERIQPTLKLLQGGTFPQGQPTDEDIRRVLKAGHKLLAINLYRELHKVPLKQAVEAIKQMSQY